MHLLKYTQKKIVKGQLLIQLEYQNRANFKELKTRILYNFKREYVIKTLWN